jgi:N-formylglutamate amidohydrolase
MDPDDDRLPYRLMLPARRTTSVIFASPHSGRDYPDAFLRRSVLDAQMIRSSEDAFIDRLLDPAPGLGAPLLAATVPRAYVDLNRAAEELDPALIEGARPVPHNPRVVSGLGVIPRVVAGGRAIRSGKMTLAEAEARIARAWRPYHAALAALMDESVASFGEAILIDVHSMPHEAVEGASSRAPRPQIVLGDRFGAAADAAIVSAARRARSGQADARPGADPVATALAAAGLLDAASVGREGAGTMITIPAARSQVLLPMLVDLEAAGMPIVALRLEAAADGTIGGRVEVRR